MNVLNRLLTGAALGLAVAVTSVPMALAETPPNMLVIANRIDDITTLDPAESFEFAGSDVIRNVYMKLVNFDPADLDAGYQRIVVKVPIARQIVTLDNHRLARNNKQRFQLEVFANLAA